MRYGKRHLRYCLRISLRILNLGIGGGIGKHSDFSIIVGTFRPGAIDLHGQQGVDVIAMFNSRMPFDFLHELGHRQMWRLADKNEILQAIDIWKKTDSGKIWAELNKRRLDLNAKEKLTLYENGFEEWFANGFRDFVSGKVVRNTRPEIRSLFSNVRNILAKFYRKIRDTLRNKEIVKYFDALFIKPDPYFTGDVLREHDDFIRKFREQLNNEDVVGKEGIKKSKDITLETFGFQTLYEYLTELAKKGRASQAIDPLTKLADKVYTGGGIKTFIHDMKLALGNLWKHYKGMIQKVWNRISKRTDARIKQVANYESITGRSLGGAELKRIGMSDGDISFYGKTPKTIPASELQNRAVRKIVEFVSPLSTIPASKLFKVERWEGVRRCRQS